MQKLRENKYFRVTALILGFCFLAFAFHSIIHLEHGFEHDVRECAACLAAIMILFVFSTAVCLLIVLKRYSFVLILESGSPQEIFLDSTTLRGPPQLLFI